MVLNLDGPQIRPNIDCPGKSSGVGDLARLTTDSNQVDAKDFEIRATLLSDSYGAFANQVSSTNADPALHCSACAAETFPGDRFCQECGAPQPSEVGKPAPPAVFVEPVDSVLDRFLHWVSNHPGLVLFAAAATVIGVVGLVMLTTFFSLPGDLNNALKANQLNSATDLAEKLKLSRFGALSGDDAELYSAAFHKRAQVFAGNRNFKMAFADLTKVMPSYSQFAQTQQLQSAYALLVSQPGAQPNTQPGQYLDSAQSDAIESGNGKTSPVKDIAAAAAPSSKAYSTAGAVNKNVPDKKSDNSVALKAAPSQPPEDTQETSYGTNSSKQEVNSDNEEADMAAYNRRLADYFSHHGSKDAGGSSAKDPPSFSEWVQSGKADF